MSWDFSGDQPEIIVYETQAKVPMRFRANLIERFEAEDGKRSIKFWNIYFDATTYEGAIKRADLWWLEQRAKYEKAEADKAERSRLAAERKAAKV